MCLDIKWYSFPRLALTDIVCYKDLIHKDDEPDQLITLIRGMRVTIGETYTSKLEVKKRDDYYDGESMRKKFLKIRRIEKGLHTYIEPKERKHHDIIITVKCIIPRFSWYYKGTYWIYGAYASNRLKYVEIIK